MKNYKIQIITGALAVVALFFATGLFAIAKDGVASAFNSTFAQTAENKYPVRGFHDQTDNEQCIVSGWAADADVPDQDVKVKIYADGNLVKTKTASVYRDGLEQVCTGGTCAWGDGLIDVLERGKTYTIRAVAVDPQTGEDYELSRTNTRLTCGVAVPEPTPVPCTMAAAKKDISIVPISETNGSVYAKATNNSSNCTYRVGLASYEAFMYPDLYNNQEFINTQKLYRDDIKNIAPGQTVSFNVLVPKCTVWQADLFAAKAGLNSPVPPDFRKLGDNYHLFDGRIDGDLNSCQTPPPPDDLKVVCVATPRRASPSELTTWTATATGGDGNYAYNWSGAVDGSTRIVKKNFYSTGYKDATVTVTSAGYKVSATCGIVVEMDTPEPAALNGQCVASPSQVNIGQNVNWSASASGGTGSYSYSWTGAVTGTGANKTTSYTTSGTKAATVTITSGTQSITRNCNVVVNQPDIPTLTGSCQAIPNRVDVGQTVNWSANASGGTGSYSYSWTGAVTGTGANKTASYSTAGTKAATVTITSGSQTIERTCNVIVEVPTVTLNGSCQAVPSSVRIGETVTWTANGTGGTGSYSYSWSGAELSGTGSTKTKTYSTTGTKRATVVITSGNDSVTRNCFVNVTADPVNLVAACRASASVIRPGQSVTFTAEAVGGTGNVEYSWLGSENLSGSGPSVTKSFNGVGTASATVNVSANGNTASATCNVTIVDDETPVNESLDIDCRARSNSYQVGDTVRWSVDVDGGNGNYEYEWSGTDNLRGDEDTVSKKYRTEGTKRATVTVTSGNQSETARCQVYVDDEPSDDESLDVDCTANPTSVLIGESVRWRADVDGGNGNYRYYWSGTDNLSSNNSSVTKSYTTPGYKNGTLVVTSGNQTVTASCNVLVSAATVTNLPLPPSDPLSYVYLNQIPYTGIMDDMGKVLNLLLLVMWSAAIAFVGVKFWNKRDQFAFAGIADTDETVGGFSKFKNILASIIPGAFESPYMEADNDAEGDAEVIEEEEKDDEEEVIEEDEISSRDVTALASLAASKKALISTAALRSVYDEFGGNFEEASLELLKMIDDASLSYPREDGWLVLTTERLTALK